MTHDPKWAQHFYFDDYISFNGLRINQRECGPDTVNYYGELFIGDARQRLLNVISLFVLTCGAGKSLMMISTLQAINEQVKSKISSAPRVGKVLWLVKERLLGVMLKHELDREIVKYGLHHSKPDVVLYDETGDIDQGPLHHDIVISCPHVLWETRAKTKRSDERVREILTGWDTIIWDECDFADEQTKRLAEFAPHALKFGLTASPINADGQLLRHFAIASYATYEKVFDNDHCLKKLLPWNEARDKGYIREISHEGYDVLDGTVVTSLRGKHRDNRALPGSIAAIRAALVDCNNLEQEMRRMWPENWYSPHILVRSSSKSECEHLCEITNEQIPLLNLQGEGWRATRIYDDFGNDKREEKHLFHKDSNLIHPFMRAATVPTLRGRCDERSSRILFVVDMAVRGMNCWPLLFLVDIARGASVNIQVQFKGRDCRLPKMLGGLHADKFFEKFCTGRYYRPDSGGSPGEMQAAYEFIFNMEERIVEANLLDWERILSGESMNVRGEVSGLAPPFSSGDQIQIDTQLGMIVQGGEEPTDEDIEIIVANLPGGKDESRIKKAKEHIKNVLDPSLVGQGYRDEIRHPIFTVIRPIHHEEPKPIEQYTLAELVTFATEHPKWKDFSDEITKDIATNKAIQKLVAVDLRERDLRLHRPVSKVFQLHAQDGKLGIITTISRRLAADLYARGVADSSRKEIRGAIPKAVGAAVAKLCNCESTANDGPLDRPSYHHALVMPNNQHMIKKLAISLLVERGFLSDAATLYDTYDRKGHSDAAE